MMKLRRYKITRGLGKSNIYTMTASSLKGVCILTLPDFEEEMPFRSKWQRKQIFSLWNHRYNLLYRRDKWMITVKYFTVENRAQ